MDYEPFYTVNVTEGANDIPITAASAQTNTSKRVVRINVEGWQNNRIKLQTIVLNEVRTFRIYGCPAVC